MTIRSRGYNSCGATCVSSHELALEADLRTRCEARRIRKGSRNRAKMQFALVSHFVAG